MMRFLAGMGLLSCISVANSATFTVTSTASCGPSACGLSLACTRALNWPSLACTVSPSR